MMALRMLWEEDENKRGGFWETAFRIAASEAGGAFCRMLPARVAAEAMTRREDFTTVISCLRDSASQDRDAALFLTRHCFGALLAKVIPEERILGERAAPWSRIARDLAEAAIADLIWPLKAVVRQWTEQPERLSRSQKEDLGICARLLLGCAAAREHYDESAVICAIQGVVRTFETASAESARLLRLLLTEEHVRDYGYKELFWLAQQFDSLLMHAPDVLADIYRAAYCTPLPSEDDTTTLGSSRIVTLLSNKRQDFEATQHYLEGKVGRFVENEPRTAAEALIDALERVQKISY